MIDARVVLVLVVLVAAVAVWLTAFGGRTPQVTWDVQGGSTEPVIYQEGP